MTTPPTVLEAEPGTRLAELAARYDEAKALADESAKALKAITDAIKVELEAAAPGNPKVDLHAQGLARPLRMSWVERWDLDTKALKAADPVTYVTYAKKSGRWQLAQVRSS